MTSGESESFLEQTATQRMGPDLGLRPGFVLNQSELNHTIILLPSQMFDVEGCVEVSRMC